MVEYTFPIDAVFGALADPTRRDILRRVASTEMTVSEIAEEYSLTLAAVSKHLQVLEKARMIIKRRRGRERLVSVAPESLMEASEYLEFFRTLWERRLERLEEYLQDKEDTWPKTN